MTNTARETGHRDFVRPIYRVIFSRFDILIASFGVNILTIALPLVVLQVYDRIIPLASVDTFTFMVIGLIVVIFLDSALRALRSRVTNWAASRFEHAASNRGILKILGADIQDFEKAPPGVQMDRFNSIETLSDHQSGQGMVTFTELPFAALFLGLIAVIGGNLVVTPMAVTALAGIFAIWLGYNLDKVIREKNHLEAKRYNFMFEVLNGIHTVKALGMEAQMQRQYQSIHAPLSKVLERLTYLSTLGQSLGTTFSNLAMASVAVLGSVMVIEGTITGGSLMACTLLAGRAVQPLIKMIGVWIQYRNNKLAREQLLNIAELKQEPSSLEHRANTPTIDGHIELRNVTVHRGHPDVPILQNVNLEIAPGEIVAITGPMGGGKSVFLEILGGFIPIDGGSLLYDGVDLAKLDVRELRKQIGYVSQYSTLYQGTLLDNLTKFRGRDYLHDALEVANDLGLTDIIATMPKGLNTRIGDAASDNLARSVQQLIVLTLIFADQPKILLLDEAGSALDGDADRRLREYLEALRGKATVLMVTERPSMMAIADRTMEVNAGQVTILPNKKSFGGAPTMTGQKPIADTNGTSHSAQTSATQTEILSANSGESWERS